MIHDNQFYVLSGEQLREYGIHIVQETINAMHTDSNKCSATAEPKYVYGLRGIQDLFDVSRTMAQEYKNTFLQPAVVQRGRKIMIDRDKAIELFKEHKTL